MQPRLPSSKQWTQLPAELVKQMKSVFENGFKAQLGGAEAEIDGRIYPGEFLLSVGFARPNQLKQPNFEISAAYDSKKDNVLKLIHTVFDAMGALFDQYFQATDDSEFPKYWEEIDFEGKKLFIQFTTKNSKLEKQADALLGEDDDSMLRMDDEDDEQELAEIKAKLGLDEDDDSGDGDPGQRH